jgi:hypothetical protein
VRLTGFEGRHETQFFETLVAIVTVLERDGGSTDLLHIFEDATMNGLFLQRVDEALGNPVGLRLGDEGEARRDTPEFQLVAEIVRRVLRAVIHAQKSGPGKASAPVPGFVRMGMSSGAADATMHF